ncbi:universal stress protein [Undibacterium sp. Ren11W]|uniref:universal stress protein n=1 Tax=Undibacterium sp. Ren11W TaxID=3413045 RepID=UPI003BF3977B
MSYKSLTVFLDNSAGSSRRLSFALALAQRFGAHLHALHLTYSPIIMSDPYAVWAPMLVEWEESAQAKHDLAKQAFLDEAKNAGVAVDWLGFRSDDFRELIAYARASDLIVLGQRNPSEVEGDFGRGFPENVVLKLGRPAIFLPYIGDTTCNFERVIVAWDGGREAARAMADALPILKEAKQVKILSISEHVDDDHDLPDVDIAAYLAMHGVSVEIERNENIAMAPAAWLLSRAADMDAQLLVMGAYGHSRLTELVFGGVTRAIMTQMTLPVLMSH